MLVLGDDVALPPQLINKLIPAQQVNADNQRRMLAGTVTEKEGISAHMIALVDVTSIRVFDVSCFAALAVWVKPDIHLFAQLQGAGVRETQCHAVDGDTGVGDQIADTPLNQDRLCAIGCFRFGGMNWML